MKRSYGSRPFRARRFVKRATDLLLVVPAFIVLLPLMVVLGLSIRFGAGGPVLFRQARSGMDGTPFTLLKFRTMNDARGSEGRLLPDGDRLTRLGRFLRRTSLDELPTLINVLKGEMSLVGPRPLITDYIDRYSPQQLRRLAMRPGITGWNQINGRNALSWEQKLALDVWYVENWSFWLDIKILAVTAGKVISGHGVTAPGNATMPEFMGTERGEPD